MCYGGMDFIHFQVISLETGYETTEFLIISFSFIKTKILCEFKPSHLFFLKSFHFAM